MNRNAYLTLFALYVFCICLGVGHIAVLIETPCNGVLSWSNCSSTPFGACMMFVSVAAGAFLYESLSASKKHSQRQWYRTVMHLLFLPLFTMALIAVLPILVISLFPVAASGLVFADVCSAKYIAAGGGSKRLKDVLVI